MKNNEHYPENSNYGHPKKNKLFKKGKLDARLDFMCIYTI